LADETALMSANANDIALANLLIEAGASVEIPPELDALALRRQQRPSTP
jgi:hypothetical protein